MRSTTTHAGWRRLIATVPVSAALLVGGTPGAGAGTRELPAGALVEHDVTASLEQRLDDSPEDYVEAVYRDLLGRSPDPEGLKAWADLLRAGTPYAAVANGITYSHEFRADLVTDGYGRYLGRDPEKPGLDSWVLAMDLGAHIQQMEAGLLASAEYYATAGSNDLAWITSVHSDVLGREPGPDEVAYWSARIQTSGRRTVALELLSSTEHLSIVVNGYYEGLLGRAVDAGGLQSWVQALRSGHRSEEIIAGIVASDEYRAGTSP